jgi:hypothetical protein
MKIAYCFLLADQLNNPKIWADYFNQHPVGWSVYTHYYQDPINQPLPFPNTRVETQPTSWEHTTNAHFSLYKNAIKDGADWIILLSESCIPVETPTTVINTLQNSDADLLLTTMVRANNTLKPYWQNRRDSWRGQLHLPEIIFAEQWCILNNKVATLLLAKEEVIKNGLKNINADNEIIFSYLANEDIRIKAGKWWYIDWPDRSPHPNWLNEIDLTQTNALFSRKFKPNAEIKNKIADYRRSLQIFTHIYNEEIFIDIYKVAILRYWRQEIDKHRWYFSLTEGKQYSTTFLQLLNRFPGAIIEYYPNVGYDILPFIEQFKTHWDGHSDIIKLHSKTNRHWRNDLIYPLLRSAAAIKVALVENDIVGARRWWTNQHWGNEVYFQQIHPDLPNDFHFIAGTMFAANKNYLQHLYQFPHYPERWNESTPGIGCSYSHAWERAFFGLAKLWNNKIGLI